MGGVRFTDREMILFERALLQQAAELTAYKDAEMLAHIREPAHIANLSNEASRFEALARRISAATASQGLSNFTVKEMIFIEDALATAMDSARRGARAEAAKGTRLSAADSRDSSDRAEAYSALGFKLESLLEAITSAPGYRRSEA